MLFYCSLISAFSFSQLKNGYEIDITIHGLQDSTVFLAYHLGDKQYIKDTIKLDKAGHGIASGTGSPASGYLYDCASGKKIF